MVPQGMSRSVEARHGRGGNRLPGMVPDLAHQALSGPAVSSCRRGSYSYPSLVPQALEKMTGVMGGPPSPHLQALGRPAVDDRGIVSPALLPGACLVMYRPAMKGGAVFPS